MPYIHIYTYIYTVLRILPPTCACTVWDVSDRGSKKFVTAHKVASMHGGVHHRPQVLPLSTVTVAIHPNSTIHLNTTIHLNSTIHLNTTVHLNSTTVALHPNTATVALYPNTTIRLNTTTVAIHPNTTIRQRKLFALNMQ